MIPLLSISQSGYPKPTVLNGDSVVCITYDQIKRINILKIDFEHYYQLSLFQDTTIKYLNLDLNIKEDKIKNLSSQIVNYKLIDQSNTEIINLQNKQIKRQQKSKTWAIIGSLAGGFIAGSLTTYFITK